MSWYGSTESSEVAPNWWLRLLDCILTDSLYQECLQSASSLVALRRVPIYRRALAWARASPPPPISSPSPQTLARLRANQQIRAASEQNTTLVCTSRALSHVPDELRDRAIHLSSMPISRPVHWEKLNVNVDILCERCDDILPFKERHRSVLSADLTRLYCCDDCHSVEAVAYSAACSKNVAIANRIIEHWQASPSWPFTTIAVKDGLRVCCLPLDSRVALGMTMIERTSLAVGLDPEQTEFLNGSWMCLQEILNSVLVLEEQERQRRNAIEVARTKFHSTLQRAVETARASEA